MPKLLYYDQLRQILIKEYIEGESLTTIIVKDQLTIDHVQQIVDMRDALYPYLNIDYYPTNFIFKKGKLYYVDYECNHYDYEYSFENWGIYFLVNPKGWQAVLERGDYSLLMKNNKPIKTGFEDIAARWLYDANRSYIDMRRRY